jgi:hypothetical protein
VRGDFGPDFERRARSEGEVLRGRLDTREHAALDDATRYLRRVVAAQDQARIQQVAEKPALASLLRDVAWEETLDPAPDGTPWVFDALPSCPRCGSRQVIIADGERYRRGIVRPGERHEITSNAWRLRSDAEKADRVCAIVEATFDAVAERGVPQRLTAPRWLHDYTHQEPVLPIAGHPSYFAPRRPT